MSMVYFYLFIAIIMEVVATSALKASDEFTKIAPSLIVITGYIISYYLLSLVLRTFPVGVTYAIWSGLGIILVTITSIILYQQTPDAAAIIGMVLILAGVIIINLYSNMAA